MGEYRSWLNMNFGLYRDDCLGVSSSTPRHLENIKKKFVKCLENMSWMTPLKQTKRCPLSLTLSWTSSHAPVTVLSTLWLVPLGTSSSCRWSMERYVNDYSWNTYTKNIKYYIHITNMNFTQFLSLTERKNLNKIKNVEKNTV